METTTFGFYETRIKIVSRKRGESTKKHVTSLSPKKKKGKK